MTLATSRYGAADVRYVAAFQPEASPPRMQMALAIADTLWKPADRERITVLDIGCGRGITACLLAAANPGWDVIGLDLQPVHIAEAREVAAEAGLDNARFIEADLAELDAESSARLLPEIDVVICYGVWTWVPDPVRQGIVRMLHSRLKPGGLVMFGYNSLPGFSDCLVLQRLLEEAARGMPGSDEDRGRAALAAIEALRKAEARYLPPDQVLDHILKRGRSAPAYMVHEWLTSFWRPVFHADLARDLAPARLEYGGCARPGQSLPELHLGTSHREAIAAAPPGMARETLTDTFLNRRFRTDIFVRGRRPGGRRMLAGMRIALAADPAAVKIGIPTAGGEAGLPDDQAATLVEALAGGPKTLGELSLLPGCEDLRPVDIAVMLMESGVANPVWRDPPAADDPARLRAARCNAAMVKHFAYEASAINAPLGVVVPALGSALPHSASDLAVVVAMQRGCPPEPARIAEWLTDAEDGEEARLRTEAGVKRLLDNHLGAWRAMGLL